MSPTDAKDGGAAAPVGSGPGSEGLSPDQPSEIGIQKRFARTLRNFFRPARGSSTWRRVLPWATALVVVIGVVIAAAYLWTYTNSPEFCGQSCHTMPPEYAAYELSPHSRVKCVECHIGRDFIGAQIFRKAGDLRHVIAATFKTYEYPIYAKNMRPAPQICEKCHSPEKFSDESLRINTHFASDEANTESSIYLLMKTGGGTKSEGLGRGIHWHIENKVEFLSTDKLDQTIPYVRVTYDDGSVTEYVDAESDLDTSAVAPNSLKTVDCMTCHNRITHVVPMPDQAVDSAIARGVISSDIPNLRKKGVEALTREYLDKDEALAGIAELEGYYEQTYPDFYSQSQDEVEAAVAELQRIYSASVFEDQKVDWTTHPDNLGHIYFPGCFRCHDGKHLSAENEAIRLECNLCHSVPVVSAQTDFVTNIEISRGPEPDSHRNSNWISLHNQAFDETCANCHNVEDAGGTSNKSFCSNPACHGTIFKFAGFDAPALREILKEQLSPPTTVPQPSAAGDLTYDTFAGPLFKAKCGSCHGSNASAGLDLTTYASAMGGGSEGPVIVAGDSAHSRLVLVQSGQHFANFSAAELEAIKAWIDAGAPETP